MPLKKFCKYFLIVFISLFLTSCKKKKEVALTPSPTPKVVEIELKDKPYISLTPRADGHELKLDISEIPDLINGVEYELIYVANDEGLVIEKGLAGTLEINGTKASQDLLLGTASCTNGCKYKYDSGVTGGSLLLTFTTTQNQIALYETNFVLTTTADIKKNGITFEDISIKATPKALEYFIILKNYNQAYSIFSSSSGLAKIDSITPGFVKEDQTKLVGDYSK